MKYFYDRDNQILLKVNEETGFIKAFGALKASDVGVPDKEVITVKEVAGGGKRKYTKRAGKKEKPEKKVKGKKRRSHCGNCGEVGHRVETCPNPKATSAPTPREEAQADGPKPLTSPQFSEVRRRVHVNKEEISPLAEEFGLEEKEIRLAAGSPHYMAYIGNRKNL